MTHALFSDELDSFFLILVTFVVLLVFISTIIEICMVKKCYGISRKLLTSPKNQVNQVFFATASFKFSIKFSLVSNYNRLFNDLEPSELDFIHSIKFLTMLLVILGHCVLMHSVLPFSNPEFIESVSCMCLNCILIKHAMKFIGIHTNRNIRKLFQCSFSMER